MYLNDGVPTPVLYTGTQSRQKNKRSAIYTQSRIASVLPLRGVVYYFQVVNQSRFMQIYPTTAPVFLRKLAKTEQH